MPRGPLDKKKGQFGEPGRFEFDVGGDFTGFLPGSRGEAYISEEFPEEAPGSGRAMWGIEPSREDQAMLEAFPSIWAPPSPEFLTAFDVPSDQPPPTGLLHEFDARAPGLPPGTLPPALAAAKIFGDVGAQAVSPLIDYGKKAWKEIQESKQKRADEELKEVRGILGQVAYEQASAEKGFEDDMAEFHSNYFVQVGPLVGKRGYRLSDLRDPWNAPEEELAFTASTFVHDTFFPTDREDIHAVASKFNQGYNADRIPESKLAMQALLNRYPSYKEKAIRHLWGRIKKRWDKLKEPISESETHREAQIKAARRSGQLAELQPFYRLLGGKFAEDDKNRRTLLKEVNAGAVRDTWNEQLGWALGEGVDVVEKELPAGYAERGINLEKLKAEIEKRQGYKTALLYPEALALAGVEYESTKEMVRAGETPTDPSVTVTIRQPGAGSLLGEFFLGDVGVTYGPEREISVSEMSDGQLEEARDMLTQEQLKVTQWQFAGTHVDAAGKQIVSMSPPKDLAPEEFGLISANTLPPERWVLPLLAAVHSGDKEKFQSVYAQVSSDYSILYKNPGDKEAHARIGKVIFDAISYNRGVHGDTGYTELTTENYREKLQGLFRFFVPMPVTWFRNNGEPWVYDYEGKKIPIYPVRDDVYQDLVDAVQEGKPQSIEYVRSLNPEEEIYLLDRQEKYLKQLLLSSGLYGDRATYGWWGEMLGKNSIISSVRWHELLASGYPLDKGNLTPTQLMMWYKNNQIDVSHSAFLHASWMRELARKMVQSGSGEPLWYRMPKHWLGSVGDLASTAVQGLSAIATGVPKWAVETAWSAGGDPLMGLATIPSMAPEQQSEFEAQLRKPLEIGSELWSSTIHYLADYAEPTVRKRRLMMDLPWAVSDVLMVWGAAAGLGRLGGKSVSFLGRRAKAIQIMMSKKINPMKYDPDFARTIQKPLKMEPIGDISEMARPPLLDENLRGNQSHYDHFRKPGTATPPGTGFLNDIIYLGDDVDALFKSITPESIVNKLRSIPKELAKRGDAVGQLASAIVVAGDWGGGKIRVLVENQSGKPIVMHMVSAEATQEAINAIVKRMVVDGEASPARIAAARREFTRIMAELSAEGEIPGLLLYEFEYLPAAGRPKFRLRKKDILPEETAQGAPAYIVEDIASKEVVGEYPTAAQARASMEEGTFIDKTSSSMNAMDEVVPHGIPDGVQLERIPGEEVKGYQLVDKKTEKRVFASKDLEEIEAFRRKQGEHLQPQPEQKYKMVEAVFLEDPADSAYRLIDRMGREIESFPNKEAAYSRLREIGFGAPQKFAVTAKELSLALGGEAALNLVQQVLAQVARRKNINLLAGPANPLDGVLGIKIPIKDIEGNIHQLDAVKVGLLRPRGKTYELSPMAEMMIRDSSAGAAGVEYVLTPAINGMEEIAFFNEIFGPNGGGPLVVVSGHEMGRYNRPLVSMDAPVLAAEPVQPPLPGIDADLVPPPIPEAGRFPYTPPPIPEEAIPAAKRISWEERMPEDSPRYWQYIREQAYEQKRLKSLSPEAKISEIASMDFQEAVKLLGTKLDVDSAYTSILEPQAAAIIRRLGTRDLQKIADYYSKQLGVFIEVKEALPHDLSKMEVTIRPPKRRSVPPGTDPTSLDAWEITIPLKPRMKVVGETATGKPTHVQFAPGRVELRVTPHARHPKVPEDLRAPKKELTPALRRSAKGLQQKIRSKLFKKKKELEAKLAEVEGMVIRPRKTEKRTEAALRKKLDAEQKLRDEIAEVEAGVVESQRIIDLAAPGGLEATQKLGRVTQTAYIPRGNFSVSVLRQAIEQLANHAHNEGTRSTLRIPFVLKEDTVYLATSPEIQQKGLVRDAAIVGKIKGSHLKKSRIINFADFGGGDIRLPSKFSRREKVLPPKAIAAPAPTKPTPKAPPKPRVAKPPEYLQTFEQWLTNKVTTKKELARVKKKPASAWVEEYRSIVSEAIKDGSYAKALTPGKLGVSLADRDLVGQVILSAGLKIPTSLDDFYYGLKPSGGPLLYNLNKTRVNQIVGSREVFEAPHLAPTGLVASGMEAGKLPREVVPYTWIAEQFGLKTKRGIALFDHVLGNDGTMIRRPAEINNLIADVMGEEVFFETKMPQSNGISAGWDDVIPDQLERDSGFGQGLAILTDKNGRAISNKLWMERFAEYAKTDKKAAQLINQYLNRVDYIDARDTPLGRMYAEYGAEALEPMAKLATSDLMTDALAQKMPSLNPRNWANGQWKKNHKHPIEQVKAAYSSLSAEALATWDVWRRGVGDIPPLAELYGYGDDWVKAGLAKPVKDVSGKVVSYDPTNLGFLAALFNIGKRNEFYKNIPFRALTGSAARGIAPQLRVDFKRIIDTIPTEGGGREVKHILSALNDLERGQTWLSDPIIAYQNAILSYAGDAGMFPTTNSLLNAIQYFRNLWEGAFDDYARVATGKQIASTSVAKSRSTKGYSQLEIERVEQLTGKFRINLDPQMFVGWVMAELETRVNFMNIIETMIDEGIIRPASQEILDIVAKKKKLVTEGETPITPGATYQELDLSQYFDKMHNRTAKTEGAQVGAAGILLDGIKEKYGTLYGTPQAAQLLELQVSLVNKMQSKSKEFAHSINPVNDIFYNSQGNIRPKKEVLHRALEALGPEIEPIIRDAYTDVAIASGKGYNPDIAVRKMLSSSAAVMSQVMASIIDKMAGWSNQLNKHALQRWYKTNALFRSSYRGAARNLFGNFAMAAAHHPEAFADPIYWEGMRHFWGGPRIGKGGKLAAFDPERLAVFKEGVGAIGARKRTVEVKTADGSVVEMEVFREHPLPPDVQQFQYEMIARNIIGNGPSWEVRGEVPALMRNYYGNSRTSVFREIMTEAALKNETQSIKQLESTLRVKLGTDTITQFMDAFNNSSELKALVRDAVEAEGHHKVGAFLNTNWRKKAKKAREVAFDFPFNTQAGRNLEAFIKSMFVITDDVYRWNYAYWLWKRKKLSFDEITIKVGEFMPDFVRNSPAMHAMRLMNPWAFWPVKTARNIMLLASRRPVFMGAMRQVSLWMDALEMSEMSPDEQWAYFLRPARERQWLFRTPMGDYSFGYSFYTGDLDTLYDPMAAASVGATGMVGDAIRIGLSALHEPTGRVFNDTFKPRFGQRERLAGLPDNLAYLWSHFHNTYGPRLGVDIASTVGHTAKAFSPGGEFWPLQEHIWKTDDKAGSLLRSLRFLSSVATRGGGAVIQKIHRVLGEPTSPEGLEAYGLLEDGIFYQQARGTKDPLKLADLFMEEILGFDAADRNVARQHLASIIREQGDLPSAVQYIRSKGPDFLGKEAIPKEQRVQYVEDVYGKRAPFEASARTDEVMKRILTALVKRPELIPDFEKHLRDLNEKSPSPEVSNLLKMVLGMKIQGIPTEKGETQ